MEKRIDMCRKLRHAGDSHAFCPLFALPARPAGRPSIPTAQTAFPVLYVTFLESGMFFRSLHHCVFSPSLLGKRPEPEPLFRNSPQNEIGFILIRLVLEFSGGRVLSYRSTGHLLLTCKSLHVHVIILQEMKCILSSACRIRFFRDADVQTSCIGLSTLSDGEKKSNARREKPVNWRYAKADAKSCHGLPPSSLSPPGLDRGS